jgi:uncharacterized protein (DUF1697 family)
MAADPLLSTDPLPLTGYTAVCRPRVAALIFAPMPQYVAFLRAINVGGHIVRMEQLRSLFEGLGFARVETFIASGNVLFETRSKNMKALEKKIEACLHDALGYEVRTFIRSASEIEAIANYDPFKTATREGESTVLYIAFLEGLPSIEAHQKLASYIPEADDLKLFGRELYWLCCTKLSESQFSGARIEKVLGMKCTLRNSTTVKKIAAKYA